MSNHIIFLKRAFELAEYGRGHVSPNPMVGCVVVHNEKIIGEGWHMAYGGPHAEVNAINNVEDKSLLPESTVYVTLEPCSHFGKTPPCADLLVKHRVKKVVISNLDINPLVAGRGIQKLKEAGIEVEENILTEAGEEVNKRFFTFHRKKRPYIILKWAETSDGFIAREDYDSKWISNELSRKLVHKWRSEEDAILVGANTALYDDPQLNVRGWQGKDPLRIVIDRNLKLPARLQLFDRNIKTLVINTVKDENSGNLVYVKLRQDSFFEGMMSYLHDQNILSLIVEGGAKILQEFIDRGLWDEARIFKSEIKFKTGIDAPVIKGQLTNIDTLLNDQLIIYKPRA